MLEMWVDKYRPLTLSDYICKDDARRDMISKWIKDGIPHILLAGRPGTGKTSLAYVLMNELGVDGGDILFVNASSERKVDDLDAKINQFAQLYPMGDCRYIILDECDALTPLMQRTLRHTMERYSDTARFILTCNDPAKLIDAIHSRVTTVEFDELSYDEFYTKVVKVLVEENIKFDDDALIHIVEATYPDMRRCLGTLQVNSSTGTLVIPSETIVDRHEFASNIITAVKKGNILEARKLVLDYAAIEDISNIFRWMYDNLDELTSDPNIKCELILVIAKYLRFHNSTALVYQDINLSACVVDVVKLIRDTNTM